MHVLRLSGSLSAYLKSKSLKVCVQLLGTSVCAHVSVQLCTFVCGFVYMCESVDPSGYLLQLCFAETEVFSPVRLCGSTCDKLKGERR